ncbi:MAG: glycerol-3-phosphate 1-O-acyltransferase PlsY [Synechococcales bacterium]|nr:glycerol-3-phosphate 1-O-acyltransferase PlsY [Synechococcales bacterium]
MIPWFIIAAAIVVAYLLGSIPTGYLAAKWLKGIDIRTVGSGSTGATNVLRTLGKPAGIAVLAIDVLKGVLAILGMKFAYLFIVNTLCNLTADQQQVMQPILSAIHAGQAVGGTISDPAIVNCLNFYNSYPWAIVAAGLAAILGHSRSIFLNFTGGKSVATSLGVLLSLNPFVGLCTLGMFLITIAITRIVSISSIVAAISTTGFMFLYQQPLAFCLFAIAGGIYVILRHRANIARLLAGQEPKLGQKVN